MIAVMEKADVPAPSQTGQKIQQGTGALGEFEAHQHLVGEALGMAADHEADVELGGLVLRHVHHPKTLLPQPGQEFLALFVAPSQLDAHEDLGPPPVGITIVELGDLAPAQGAAEFQEAAGPLRDLDRQQGLPALAEFGALGDVA